MSFATVSYAASAVAYALLTALLVFNREVAGRRAHWLLVATAGAMLWGLVIAISSHTAGGSNAPSVATYIADALRAYVWTLCLLALSQGEWQGGGRRVIAISATVLAAAAVLIALFEYAAAAQMALLGLSIVGCLALEQIFRNATIEQRRRLRPFLWTLVVILCYDLFVFSDATLLGDIDFNVWAFRGFLAALAAPAFLLTAKRQPDWTETLFISRHVVF
jgi:hypothetical protein